MSHRRPDLEEMTALYLIPIVAVVIVAASGGIVARALPGRNNQLWTLVISYILWGLGTPLSWIILTVYFLRLTVHRPIKREVVVSLLLPIGPLSLSGFRYGFKICDVQVLISRSAIVLGKDAKHLFAETHTLPLVSQANPGDIFYINGFMVGLLLFGFSCIWFIVAAIMIATAGGLPFNMGFWGFIFPVGQYSLPHSQNSC
jgi:tellurite resistance protein TehA-like permease